MASYSPGYIEGTETPVSSSSISQFSADWYVPENPSIGSVPVSIWNGLRTCVDGNPHIGLVQPVLNWNFPGYPKQWTIAPFYVWENSTPTNHDFIVGQILTGVSTGDNIHGSMQIYQSDAATITDTTTGESLNFK